jgi:hypothetical protein
MLAAGFLELLLAGRELLATVSLKARMESRIEELLDQIGELRHRAEWLHQEHERLCVQFIAILARRADQDL